MSRYDAENYNCVDMSYDIGRMFANAGIPAKMVYGCHLVPNGTIQSAHCWLLLWDKIEFETYDLTFRPVSDYYSAYLVYQDVDTLICYEKVNGSYAEL
jgi:hypothetical protein